ncbi:MAG: ribosomal RNA small subunit methyltransferase A [Ignavibacterium sp.]|nr:ribosomal RNA small subunit methyltransferase A [Ignavibacterium sp.]
MNSVRPLKKFGQNYLKDKNILKKIVDEINPLEQDNLLEIGPGMGSLTEVLVEKGISFTAVEIDKRVIDDLRTRYQSVNIIQNDILELNLNKLLRTETDKLRIAGNIPYNLTSPILFKMIENSVIIKDAVLMVQYEVAKRITAKQGMKDYGILAVVLSYFADVKLAFKVSANVFYPKPKVESAVVHLFFKNIEQNQAFQKTFIKAVKAAFGNRRKMLRNSLSNSIFAEINFSESGIDLSKRAEQLSLDDFLLLTEFILKKQI